MVAIWVLMFVCLSPLIAALWEHREWVKFNDERRKK